MTCELPLCKCSKVCYLIKGEKTFAQRVTKRPLAYFSPPIIKLCQFVLGVGGYASDSLRRIFHPTLGCIGNFKARNRPETTSTRVSGEPYKPNSNTMHGPRCPRLVGAPGFGGTQGLSCKGALGAGCWRGKARGLVERCTREGERIAWRGHGARVGRLLHPRVGHRVGGRLVTWDPHRTPCSYR